MRSAILTWWLTLTAVGAEPVALDAASYNDMVVGHQAMTSLRLEATARAMAAATDPTARATGLARWRAEVKAALARARALPDHQGDPSLREALVLGLLHLDERVGELLDALAARDPSAVDPEALARWEALYGEARASEAQVREQLSQAQATFAGRHGLRLPEPVDLAAEEGDFVAPGVPPVGSPLSGALWASLSLDHHNAVVGLQERAVRALEVVLKAPPGDRSAALARGLAEVDAVVETLRAVGAWGGDDGLQRAALEVARGAAELMAGPGRVWAATEGGPLSGRRRREVWEATQRLEARAGLGFAGFEEARLAFVARWQLAAFLSWREGGPP